MDVQYEIENSSYLIVDFRGVVGFDSSLDILVNRVEVYDISYQILQE